jgi:hypothetical protein
MSTADRGCSARLHPPIDETSDDIVGFSAPNLTHVAPMTRSEALTEDDLRAVARDSGVAEKAHP